MLRFTCTSWEKKKEKKNREREERKGLQMLTFTCKHQHQGPVKNRNCQQTKGEGRGENCQTKNEKCTLIYRNYALFFFFLVNRIACSWLRLWVRQALEVTESSSCLLKLVTGRTSLVLSVFCHGSSVRDSHLSCGWCLVFCRLSRTVQSWLPVVM